MASKLVVLACLVVAARGSGVAFAPQPVVAAQRLVAAQPVVAARVLEEIDPSQYSFGYNVEDTNTGDFKSQQEVRSGGVVKGYYTFLESDGTRRVVDYTADSVNGFNAVVRNEALAVAAPAVVEEAVVQERYAAPALVEEVLPARVAAAAPVPFVTEQVARFAPVASRYAVAGAPAPVAEVVNAAPVFQRYISPFAAYRAFPTSVSAAPVAAAYTSPVAAAYSAPVAAAYASRIAAAYSAPVSAAYASPIAAAYAAPVAAAYSAPAAPAYSALVGADYRFSSRGSVVAAPAPPPARLTAAPAKLVAPAPAEGYRYP